MTTETDLRAARIADARQILDLLEANPGIPFCYLRIEHIASVSAKDDDVARAEVDRVAALLGVEAGFPWEGAHYQANKMIGSACYQVIMVSKSAMKRYDVVQSLGEAALTAVEAAVEQDGQEDVFHAAPPIGGGKSPRCGASGLTVLFASDVTCQECRSLMAQQARAADEPDFFDAAEAEDVRQIRREMAIDAGDDSEGLRQEAEDDASNERFAAALAATTDARRAQTRHERAIACEDSCGGEGVCAFGPHDTITTPPVTTPGEAP
jgi:hypothetical protein